MVSTMALLQFAEELGAVEHEGPLVTKRGEPGGVGLGVHQLHQIGVHGLLHAPHRPLGLVPKPAAGVAQASGGDLHLHRRPHHRGARTDPTDRQERARALARAGRRFELFLDCLSFHATAPHHLLNDRYAAVLSEGERELREVLEPVRAWLEAHPRPDADDPVAPAWAMLSALLFELGDR
jgi:hypothetical protein